MTTGSAERALDLLERQSFLMQELFSEDPSMALTGELFEAADKLEAFGIELARHFGSSEQCEMEERALQLRVSVVQTAHAHRRDVLGPALVDWADCNRRMGRLEKADTLYHSVVEDLTTILGWGPTFNRDWIEAVKSLQKALEYSRRDYGELATRVKNVLEESERLCCAQGS